MSLQQAIKDAIGTNCQALVGVVVAANGSSVDVDLRGATQTLAKLSTYTTPTAGDVVLVLAYGGSMMVLGAIVA